MAESTGPAEAGTSDKTTLRARIRAERRARRRAEQEAGTGRRAESEDIAHAVLDHLDRCPQARDAGWGSSAATVAVFRSTPSEPDTTALIEALHDRGVRVLVPRTLDDLSLDWHELLAPAGDLRDARRQGEASAGDHHDASTGESPTAASPSEDADPARPSGEDSSAELPSDEDAGDEGPSLGLDAVADITAMILPGLAVDHAGHRLGQGGGCYDRTVPRLRPGTCRAVLLFDEEILDAVPYGEHDQLVPAVVTPRRGWTALTPAPPTP